MSTIQVNSIVDIPGTGAPDFPNGLTSTGNVGIGTTTPAARLGVSTVIIDQPTVRFTNPVSTYAVIQNQTKFSSGSVYGGVSYDALNEDGAIVATFISDIHTDGSTAWRWFTQPAGTRIDRRVERMQIDKTGNLQFNSGYGSVATAYGCRAWVNFNGTGTVAIRGSGNVTSITDNGTGLYTVNFTTAMPDVNYCVQGTCNLNTGDGYVSTLGLTSSTVQFRTRTNAALVDASEVFIAVFR